MTVVDKPEKMIVKESSNFPKAVSRGSSGQPDSGTLARPSSSSSFPKIFKFNSNGKVDMR